MPFAKKLNDCYHNTLGTSITSYFFPKKDIILPWPGFPPAFLPFAAIDDDDAAVDAGVLSLVGAGSSSEKDFQAGSSFVTRYETKSKSVFGCCSYSRGTEGYRPR